MKRNEVARGAGIADKSGRVRPSTTNFGIVSPTLMDSYFNFAGIFMISYAFTAWPVSMSVERAIATFSFF